MKFEKVINLCKRRGIIFPSAELYNGPSGFWEYGHYGETIKRRIVGLWRKMLVKSSDMLEIDGSVIMPRDVFVASGHLKSFNDPLTQCRACKSLYRADHILQEITKGPIPETLSIKKYDKLLKDNAAKCPKCSGELSKVKKFNMMFKLNIGALEKAEAYLRPETCQSIFLDFPRLFKVMKRKLPLGIAQAGRSFRNEISPRNALQRMREFNQLEIEVFSNPKNKEQKDFNKIKNYKLNLKPLKETKDFLEISAEDALKKKIIPDESAGYYLALVQKFFVECGLPIEEFRFRELDKNERAFYARSAWDFEVKTSLGWSELVANNDRSDYDLKSHGKVSKKDMAVIDGTEKIIPHVWEISMGLDRIFYAIVEKSYQEDEKRVYLRLPKHLVPIDISVFPLVAKDGLPDKAKEIFEKLKFGFEAEYFEKGSIGKRYARADEIGCPFCITVDYDTPKKNTVTIRNRDTTEQVRVSIEKLEDTLKKLLRDEINFKDAGEPVK